MANLPILDPPYIPHLLCTHQPHLADVDAATSPCHAVDSSTPPPGLFSLLTAASPIGLHAPFGPHLIVGERPVISCLTTALLSTHPAQMITDQLPDPTQHPSELAKHPGLPQQEHPANEFAAPSSNSTSAASPHSALLFTANLPLIDAAIPPVAAPPS